MIKSAVPNKIICVLSYWNKEPHLLEKGKLTELQVKKSWESASTYRSYQSFNQFKVDFKEALLANRTHARGMSSFHGLISGMLTGRVSVSAISQYDICHDGNIMEEIN